MANNKNHREIISQAEAARRAGVTQGAIGALLRRGTANFFVKKKVLAEHIEFIEYCLKHNPKEYQAPGGIDPNSSTLLDSKNRRVKAQADKAEFDLKVAQKSYVELAAVKMLVFEYLDSLNKRFLQLGQNTVDRITQIVESGDEGSRQKVIDLLSSEASREIKNTKLEINKNIRKILNAS